jgi:small GTP-binding protein
MSRSGGEVVRYRVAIVGDAGVGKTTLIRRKLNKLGDGTEAPTPAIFEQIAVQLDGQTISLDCYDTVGTESDGKHADFYLTGILAVAVCFDPLKANWVENCNKIIAGVKQKDSEARFLAIATKQDTWPDGMRKDEIERTVQSKLSISRFIETSGKTNFNVDNAFIMIAQEALTARPIDVSIFDTNRVITPGTEKSDCSC